MYRLCASVLLFAVRGSTYRRLYVGGWTGYADEFVEEALGLE